MPQGKAQRGLPGDVEHQGERAVGEDRVEPARHGVLGVVVAQSAVRQRKPSERRRDQQVVVGEERAHRTAHGVLRVEPGDQVERRRGPGQLQDPPQHRLHPSRVGASGSGQERCAQSDHLHHGRAQGGVPVDRGTRLHDDVPESFQDPARAHGRRGHLGVHRHARPRPRRHRDPQRPGARLGGKGRGAVLVADTRPGDGVEQRLGVADRAGEDEVGRRAEHRLPQVRPARRAPPARLQPDQAAARRGHPDRPGRVVRVRHRHRACRHQRRGPAARSADPAVECPRVARRTVPDRLGGEADRQLGHGRQAEGDQARGAEPGHQLVVVARDDARSQAVAAEEERHAFGERPAVLDEEGNTGERSVVRVRQCGGEERHRQPVHVGVRPFQCLARNGFHFLGADLVRADQLPQSDGVQVRVLVQFHVASLRRRRARENPTTWGCPRPTLA